MKQPLGYVEVSKETYDLICARDAALRRAEVAELEAAGLKRVLDILSRAGDLSSMQNVARVAAQRITTGDAILAELEAGRKVVEAADNGEWHSSNDCRVEGRAHECTLCVALTAYDKAKGTT